MQIILLLLGFVIGGFLVWIYSSQKREKVEEELRRTRKELEEESFFASRFSNLSSAQISENSKTKTSKTNTKNKEVDEFNRKVIDLAEDRKDNILNKLKETGSLQTGDVADMFDVSRKTAFNYLADLEEENKIAQVGDFGPEVHYVLK